MEYVMEAVKQGSAVIDLRSTTRVVLVSVNKTSLEISLHQKKIFKVDDHMGEVLENVVAVGIRGSFLVPLFVHITLQTEKESSEFAKARQLHFFANFDLIDVAWNIAGLNPETTLVVVVSKTFTTAETMLNARTLREWISSVTSALKPGTLSSKKALIMNRRRG